MFDHIPLPRKRIPRDVIASLKTKKKKLTLEERKLDRLQAKIAKEQANLKQVEKAVYGKSALVIDTTLAQATPTVQAHLIDRTIAFEPNPGPQTEFLAASEKEVFYGGARGGGKSYSLIVDPLRYCNFEIARALILRRTMPELRDLINHSMRLYPKAYPGAKWREQEKEWRFPSGARIEFGYAETQTDALRYQGQSYTWIGVDELPQFPTAGIWNDLRGSLRSVDPHNVPEFMRATGNPGNVGSTWVREMFIDPAEPNTRFNIPVELPDGSIENITRRFIPAKLADNPYLNLTKSYMTMLASLPEIQRKQWLDGNWQVWSGAAFPEFDRKIHVVEPFTIPRTWIRFRACDWGYSSPAICLWFAVDYDDNLYVYKEYKTTQTPPDKFARTVLSMEAQDKVQYGVLDSSVWARRGDIGPSIVETMQSIGCRWRPSDRSPSSRHNGKMEVHRRLALGGTNEPSLKIFSNCRNLINELPALPLDDNDPEDVNTRSNDHSYDALRYGCMSRPMNAAKLDMLISRIQKERYEPADKTFGY